MGKIITIDTETKIVPDEHALSAGVDHLVAVGLKLSHVGTCGISEWSKLSYPSRHRMVDTLFADDNLIIGQNVSFDIKRLVHGAGGISIPRNFFLWDTQIAEHVMYGTTWASLNGMAEEYGLPLKPDRIKIEYFDKGLGADHVPFPELKEYLEHDLMVTERIATLQMKQLDDPKFATVTGRAGLHKVKTLVSLMMQARMATIDAELAGMVVDLEFLSSQIPVMTKKLVELKDALTYHTIGESGHTHVMDLSSPHQLRTVLYGGTGKYSYSEQIGFFKNGKPKMKVVEKEDSITGLINPLDQDALVKINNGPLSADEGCLTRVRGYIAGSKLYATSRVPHIIDSVLEMRGLQKELSTYYVGLRRAAIPLDQKHGIIHCDLNPAATNTGRYSSSNPNLQNISNSTVKKAFVSRYMNGKLLEFDFNQLEVIGLAIVSKDEQLIADINNGADLHTVLYQDMHGYTPTKPQRKAFKPLTFALIYGASARRMSIESGHPIEYCKKFIRTFYNRYPQVQAWQKSMKDNAALHADYSEGKTFPDGRPRSTYLYTDISGRMYRFLESDKYPGSFNPTELVNYPIQGLATGTIVPMMAGIVWNVIKGIPEFTTGVRFVNMVHDSLVFDVADNLMSDVITAVRGILENTPKYFEEYFKEPLPFKTFKVGCSVGTNWYNMEEI